MTKARSIWVMVCFTASVASSACGLIVGSQKVTPRVDGEGSGGSGGGGASNGYTCSLALDFGSDVGQELGGLVLDATGNIWLAGTYQGTPSVGGSGTQLPAPDAPSDRNMFLLELAPSGEVMLTRSFDIGAVDAKLGVGGIATADGNLYVGGQFAGARNLGELCLMESPAEDDPDAFIARFDTSGLCKVVKRYTNSKTDQVAGVAAEDTNVVIAGSLNNGNGMFLHRYDLTLATDIDSFFTAGSTGGSIHPRAAAIQSDQMLVAGDFIGSFDISANGSGAALDNATDTTPDAFLAVYNLSRIGKPAPMAPYHWSEDYGSPGYQSFGAIAAGRSANTSVFFVAGEFEGTVESNIGVQGALKAVDKKDALVAAIPAAGGKALWGKRFGEDDSQSATAIAYDPMAQAVLVAGKFQGTMDLGGAPLKNIDAGDHIFLARLTEGGEPVWRQAFGTNGIQSVGALVARNGEVILAGSYTGTLDFGCSAPLSNERPTPRLFIARLKPDVH